MSVANFIPNLNLNFEEMLQSQTEIAQTKFLKYGENIRKRESTKKQDVISWLRRTL